MDLSILYIKGVTDQNFLNFKYISSLKIVFILANSADPDEMSHHVVFHLGVHCLPKYLFEPRHEISNNVVCVTSASSDQPAHMRSLIRAFVSVKLLTEHHLEFLSLKVGCTGLSATLVKMPHCWKSHVTVCLRVSMMKELR